MLSLRYRIGKKAVLELLIGDITYETTDAIVNAANSSLLGGGGVDGAIHDAAGPGLLIECKAIRAKRGDLPPGQAVTTSGGKLSAKYVIHTVGPMWQGGKANEPEILASCYSKCIAEAESKDCTSVSFPSVSTGVFGYPVQGAAKVALRTIVEQLIRPLHSLSLVRFVLFNRDAYDAYTRAAKNLSKDFPDFEIHPEPAPL